MILAVSPKRSGGFSNGRDCDILQYVDFDKQMPVRIK